MLYRPHGTMDQGVGDIAMVKIQEAGRCVICLKGDGRNASFASFGFRELNPRREIRNDYGRATFLRSGAIV
jgi:hypothetical protein